MNFNQKETIERINTYVSSLENETSSRPYKSFFSIYAKKRHTLKPLKYILGEYKFKWFEKGKQPNSYKNAFELSADLININTKDINLCPYSQKKN